MYTNNIHVNSRTCIKEASISLCTRTHMNLFFSNALFQRFIILFGIEDTEFNAPSMTASGPSWAVSTSDVRPISIRRTSDARYRYNRKIGCQIDEPRRSSAVSWRRLGNLMVFMLNGYFKKSITIFNECLGGSLLNMNDSGLKYIYYMVLRFKGLQRVRRK